MITFAQTTIELGGKVIVEDLNFTVGQGEFVCIIGASGCGKTTALRLAAGLYQPSAGGVTFDGKSMTAPRRDIAIIFQDYGKALLPWRTAAGNVSLALEAAGVPSAKRAPRIAELLTKVGLPDHAGKYPAEMSGGMQQRLQIARCLAQDPVALLMDEPFGALDAQTRMVMQNELLSLWSRQRTTILFVTHDLVEAVALADNVILLGKQPTRIKADFRIDVPRPRNVFEPFRMPGFVETYERIWATFKSEVATGAAVVA